MDQELTIVVDSEAALQDPLCHPLAPRHVSLALP
jgi:hypothetical protein